MTTAINNFDARSQASALGGPLATALNGTLQGDPRPLSMRECYVFEIEIPGIRKRRAVLTRELLKEIHDNPGVAASFPSPGLLQKIEGCPEYSFVLEIQDGTIFVLPEDKLNNIDEWILELEPAD
jgi:hypothetical protein